MNERTFSARAAGGDVVGSARGDGRPVLFLHGGPGLSDYMGEVAALVADEYEAVTYQQRGVAPSTLEPPFTVEQHVADFVAVLDHLHLARASVVGHSWGGHLALFLLASCPERLDRVVIVDGVGAYVEQLPLFEEHLTGRLGPKDRARVAEIEERQEAGTSTEHDELELMQIVWPYYHANPEDPPPFQPLRTNPRGFHETYASVMEHFDKGTLQSVLPDVADGGATTFLHGERSPLATEFMRRTAALIPGATYVELPETGHFPWMEDPERARRALKQALSATA